MPSRHVEVLDRRDPVAEISFTQAVVRRRPPSPVGISVVKATPMRAIGAV